MRIPLCERALGYTQILQLPCIELVRLDPMREVEGALLVRNQDYAADCVLFNEKPQVAPCKVMFSYAIVVEAQPCRAP